MAEKGFGVKDINLIGPSGTPTITSPNNLNLNANNVAISTNVSIGGTLSVTGNVSVGGTLTYEDVTNIDSVGIVTARAGVVVGDTSNTTFRVHRIQGASATNCGLALNSGGSLDLFTDSSGAGTSRISISAAGNIQFSTFGSTYFLLEDYVTHAGDTNTQYGFDSSDSYVVKTGGSTRLTVNNSGANVVGALTVNGSAISIDPTDSDIQVAYTVTANGSSAYRFAGNGVVSTADNPDLYLIRGQKYRFINNSGGSHPFQIRESSGGTAYSTGVTNNGASSGNIDFAPTFDSPAQLVYQCTSHGGMVGNIYLRDAAGNNTNIGITTFSGFVNVNGNFGLETSSPVAQTTAGSVALTPVLDLKGTGSLANASGVLQFTRKDNSTQGSCIYSAGEDAGLTFRNTDGNGFGFYTGTTLRFRINNSGHIFFSGMTSLTASGSNKGVVVENQSNFGRINLHANSSGGTASGVLFYHSGNNVGGINYTSSNVIYNTSSDYRLKENVTPISDGITRLKTLKPYRFNFKVDPDKTVDGFFAHEVTAVPEAITGTKDEISTEDNEERGVKKGDPIYQSIDHSKLVPLLTASLQEAIKKIETLEAEVSALKAK